MFYNRETLFQFCNENRLILLESEQYYYKIKIRSKTRLEFFCQRVGCGNIVSRLFIDWFWNGILCKYCSNTRRMTLEMCQKYASNKGGKCRSDKYISNKTNIPFENR